MTPSSFLRRLLAILYDSLLLACVILFATLLFYWIAGNNFSRDPILRIVYQSYLLILSYLFFGWFWTHGGQTLGMRAWRLRLLQQADLQPITWRQALVRYLVAILSWLAIGLGFLWALLDRQNRTWHDRLSGTALVLVPKKKTNKP